MGFGNRTKADKIERTISAQLVANSLCPSNLDNSKVRISKMLSSSTSRITLIFRCSLLQNPNFVSFSSSSSSISSLHSHSTRQVDEAVDSFTRMLSMRRTPPIIQFNKILGSLSKTNHFHAVS
ncbi:hypothetical protein Ahy_B05g075449 [Arachis hypogaea]|uniref:Pentatricopeptide repeat-containing protein n=1 Tax=Arachis hypogaea TaxID=3818 RepID=A0A444Z1A1_ARAHY|nr:hypothetical protein Ahy_B05g075449 [Arachis hypogaea]